MEELVHLVVGLGYHLGGSRSAPPVVGGGGGHDFGLSGVDDHAVFVPCVMSGELPCFQCLLASEFYEHVVSIEEQDFSFVGFLVRSVILLI